MRKWSVVFAVVSLLAIVLGFGSVALGAVRLLFCVFLVLFVAVLLISLLGNAAEQEARTVVRPRVEGVVRPRSGRGPKSSGAPFDSQVQ